ncbi:MAG TPA: cytochrome c-type biogenesis protein CcmH [Solirubrobacterales bacterium]
MRRLTLLATVVLALAAPAAATGAEPVPKTTVSDVEDEVMCPICGTLLELSDSPQARREKVYVAKLVAEGKTKAEIKDALVGQYGPAALALPEATGFDLSAYLVPIVALLVAVCALAFGVARWRRDGDRSPPPGAATAPQGEEAERLEADLRRYDL